MSYYIFSFLSLMGGVGRNAVYKSKPTTLMTQRCCDASRKMSYKLIRHLRHLIIIINDISRQKYKNPFVLWSQSLCFYVPYLP